MSFQIVFFLLSICGFCSIASAIWEGLVGYDFREYLPWESIIPTQPFQGATVLGFLVFFSYAIVMNTVVPISLYVSVEVCIKKNLLDAITHKCNFHVILPFHV